MAKEKKKKVSKEKKIKTGSNLLKDLSVKKKGRPKKVEIENDDSIKKFKTPKKIKQTFKEEDRFFITDKVIFRIREDNMDTDVLKTFTTDITFNKNKVGQKTKHPDGIFRKIIDVITDEKNLVFVVQTLE